MRLKELHINNFKFFPKLDRTSPLLKIDGKNLLIYGENGSGKSTIYWALYTLLESFFKDQDADVSKYFQRGGDHGLVNIHASANHQSHIKAVLTDGATTKEFTVSGDLATIQAIRANSHLRESAMASDFINYRVLFRLHNAKHTNDNDLFPWFEDEILPYIRLGIQSFKDEIKSLRLGPTKVRNLAGDEIFPYAGLRIDPDEGMKLNYRHYSKWDRRVTKWNNTLKRFLRTINIRANEILNQDFKQDFEIKLNLVPAKHNIIADSTTLNWLEPKVKILVPKFQKRRNAIKRAHSFLNEAKWTAIGLSIRLAILEDLTYRPSPVDLKCLVMDDMLLSLDMSNRDIVLDLLLTKYVNDYQLILMTHDRHFYELSKRKINTLGKGSDWNYIEMFQNDLGRFPVPYFKPEKESVQVAEHFLIQHDYAAAGIYLRKEVESLLTRLMPTTFCKEEKLDNGVTKMVDKKLNDLILSFKSYCAQDGIDYEQFKDLKTYKDILLNPLAHNDIDTPLFYNELRKLVELVKKLKKIQRTKAILSPHKNLGFILNKPDGTFFSVRSKNLEKVILIEEPNRPPRISIFTKCRVTGTDHNGVIDNTEEQFNTLLDVYLEMCRRFSFQPTADLSTVFSYDGSTFAQKLLIVNAP